MVSEPKTLEEMTRNVTSDAVAIARNNLNHEYEFMEKRLASLPLATAGALLNMLQTAFQHRQQAMQLAAEEHKYQAQLQAKAAQEKAQKESGGLVGRVTQEKAQKEADAAAKPRLEVPAIQ